MKYLNRTSGVLVVFLLLQMILAPIGVASRAEAAGAPYVSAQAAAVIDVASGRILYRKNADKRMRIASLTKTMTAIVAIESADIKDVVTVPQQAVGTEGSSIYLKKGEKLTLEDLLYGLMLRSGNDAAVTIAMHVGGSVQGFAHLMNEKASMIGMTHTNFTNPHGLDDSNMHYSTAEDMVKLSAYALKNPIFREIVGTKVKTISWEGEEWDRRLQNKNKMLHLYKGADGVKTGYTKLARRCLASSATRDGRQLAVITLNAPDDWDDHAKLLDFGFQQYQQVKVIGKGDTVDPEMTINRQQENLVLTTMNEFTYPFRSGEVNQVTSKISLFDRNLTTSMVGEHVGFLNVYLGKDVIGRIPLTVGEASPTFKTDKSASRFKQMWTYVWNIMAGGVLHA
ncbi:D-alanyl-D-alanine carboxypeptidase family protein [Brevibacillus dissolubilis]|uniref:D-alanyl-D-alanine carboxypeptidase family protein n=1 Tax=Brevibacillus dissolubilis TaxID=1844116 RepID=UPI001116853F|nr:D-alanyl-D-alanine carboxypeptidase family protein [Brevibacillus dissolubilis]